MENEERMRSRSFRTRNANRDARVPEDRTIYPQEDAPAPTGEALAQLRKEIIAAGERVQRLKQQKKLRRTLFNSNRFR